MILLTFLFNWCVRSEFCTATRNYAKRQLNWYRKDKSFLFVRSRRRNMEKTAADHATSEEVLHWASVPRSTFDDAVSTQIAVNDALTELRQRSKVPYAYLPDTHARRVALCWMINNGEVRVPTEADVVPLTAQPSLTPSAMSKSYAKKMARLNFKSAKKAAAGGDAEDALAAASQSNPVPGTVDGLYEEAESTSSPERSLVPPWAVSILDEKQGITPTGLAASLNSDLSALGRLIVVYSKQIIQIWCFFACLIVSFLPARFFVFMNDSVPDVRNTGVDNNKLKLFVSRVTTAESSLSYEDLIAEAIGWRTKLLAEKRDILIQFLKEETEKP